MAARKKPELLNGQNPDGSWPIYESIIPEQGFPDLIHYRAQGEIRVYVHEQEVVFDWDRQGGCDYCYLNKLLVGMITSIANTRCNVRCFVGVVNGRPVYQPDGRDNLSRTVNQHIDECQDGRDFVEENAKAFHDVFYGAK